MATLPDNTPNTPLNALRPDRDADDDLAPDLAMDSARASPSDLGVWVDPGVLPGLYLPTYQASTYQTATYPATRPLPALEPAPDLTGPGRSGAGQAAGRCPQTGQAGSRGTARVRMVDASASQSQSLPTSG